MTFLLDHDVPIEAAQAECAHLLRLLRKAGAPGIAANMNFA